MPSRVKELTVKETLERYSSAGGIVAVEYPGVTAEEATALRRELREKSVGFRVVNKNLARVAFGQLGYGELGDLMEGRIALVSAEDPVEASKAAATLAKERKFNVRGGVGDGKILSASDVNTLASIPSKKALFAQIAGLAAAPLRGLVGMIGAPGASLARVIMSWNEKRTESGESGGSAASDAQ